MSETGSPAVVCACRSEPLVAALRTHPSPSCFESTCYLGSAGLFSLSSSDSDSDHDSVGAPGSSPSARAAATSTSGSTPAVSSQDAQATRLASAQAVLASMETSSDESSDSGEEDELLLPQVKKESSVAATTTTTAAAAAAAAAAPTDTDTSHHAAPPSSSPKTISISAPNSSFKFKLSLSSSRPTVSDAGAPPAHDRAASAIAPARAAAAATHQHGATADDRKRRTVKVKADPDDDDGSAHESNSTPRSRVAARRTAGCSTSNARKKQKKGEPAHIQSESPLPVAGPPVIVERYEWLQCDEPMCGKWRKLAASQFDQRDLTFQSSSSAHPHDALAPPLEMPAFLSLHPLTFDDLIGGKFYCFMNPNLAFARCSAEEEVVADNEITIE